MCDDSAGPGPPSGQLTSALEKPCQSAGCNKPVHATGRGNHHYCAECKVARSSPATSKQSQKNKRNNSVLSPIDQSLAKQSKEDEDDFAFNFNAAFDCDLDEFLALDKDSALAKFKSFFSNAKEQAEVARSDHHRLTDELSTMRAKLSTVKLALADKDVQLFEMSRSSQSVTAKQPVNPSVSIPSASLAQSDAQTGPPSSGPANIQRAKPAKTVDSKSSTADTKPTLIAWLNKGVSKTEISLDKIDSLMNLDPDGPTVQQFKKGEDRVTLTFKDVAARDKAKSLISQNSQQILFKSVSVLQKTYPAIARLNGLRDIQAITDEDNQTEKRLRSTAIMSSLQKENPYLQGHLVSVRILSNQPDTFSFHVRLGLSAKDCCDQLIDRGRVTLDSRIHAVAMADPLKEIRHCLRCQNYGHLSRFCKSAAETCGKCAGPHATSSCTATTKDFKCANCSKNHCAGSRICPVNTKTVTQYLNYIST